MSKRSAVMYFPETWLLYFRLWFALNILVKYWCGAIEFLVCVWSNLRDDFSGSRFGPSWAVTQLWRRSGGWIEGWWVFENINKYQKQWLAAKLLGNCYGHCDVSNGLLVHVEHWSLSETAGGSISKKGVKILYSFWVRSTCDWSWERCTVKIPAFHEPNTVILCFLSHHKAADIYFIQGFLPLIKNIKVNVIFHKSKFSKLMNPILELALLDSRAVSTIGAELISWFCVNKTVLECKCVFLSEHVENGFTACVLFTCSNIHVLIAHGFSYTWKWTKKTIYSLICF